MTLTLLLTSILTTSAGQVPTSPDELAARVAVLRSYELNVRRDAWSHEALRAARGAVNDPLFKQPEPPGWLHRTLELVLEGYPLILLLAVMVGAELVWRSWRRNRLAAAFVWCVVWFVVLTALDLVVKPDARPAAVVRLDGTVLRQGNGLSYPPQVYQRAPVRLSAGVESVVRTRRANGWVQVELPRGVVGWVPQDAVYLVEARP